MSNLFNVTSVTSQTKNATTISSTWIAGTANIFGIPGQITSSRLFVAIVKGKAPATVQDLDKNGIFIAFDTKTNKVVKIFSAKIDDYGFD